MGVETPETGMLTSPVGIAMDFPVTDGAMSCSPPKMPSRLLRRMSDPKTSTPPTVEQIEAKLRHAHLRRQVTCPSADFLFFFLFLRKKNLCYAPFS